MVPDSYFVNISKESGFAASDQNFRLVSVLML